MSRSIRVLIVEDLPPDAELVVRALQRGGFAPAWQRVETEADFVAKLAEPFDLILSDYDLPQFNGLRALEIVRSRGLDVPFILVSGTIGEETAVHAMHQGAADYLMKDRLTRLGAAVERALIDMDLRRERQRTELALRESETRLKLALVASGMGVWSWEVATNTVFWSPECYAIMGLREFDGTLAGFTRWLHPEDRDRVMAEVERAVASRGVLETEFRFLNPDGSTRWISNCAQTSYDETGRALRMVGTMQNITERKRAEAELTESRERFQQVVESIQEVFWMLDVAENRPVYISPGYESIWGRSRELLYTDRNVWVDSIHEDDRARVTEGLMARQVAGRYDETYRIRRPDGTLRWIHDRAFPIKDAQGRVNRIVGVAEDITARHDLEEQFLRTQRIEAIGTLASGIAHDLNNILAPMLMIAPLLRAKVREPADVDLVDMVEQGAQRGATIIKQLLTFSRGIEGDRGPVQIRHLLKEMTVIMRETFPREIAVTESIASDLWLVSADATQIHQVLMNLCVNARDAMRHGGTLTVGARNVGFAELGPRQHLAPAPVDFVCFTVTDSGDGIAPEIIDRIFDPFFTTKEVGKGTGLGLSTATGIVKSHGGFIAVESEPGRGSSFSVYLPALKEGAEVAAERPVGDVRGHGELVLVVDDEAAIRQTLRVTLESHNYQVLLGADGRDALRLFLENRQKIRLVLTDIMMPGVNGRALIQALRQLEPELPVIAMTGLFDLSHREEFATLGVTRVLTKPCEGTELLAAIHNELAESE